MDGPLLCIMPVSWLLPVKKPVMASFLGSSFDCFFIFGFYRSISALLVAFRASHIPRQTDTDPTLIIVIIFAITDTMLTVVVVMVVVVLLLAAMMMVVMLLLVVL